MIKAFSNIFKIPDLRKRILFSIGLIAVVRFGAYLPTPGVDGAMLNQFFQDYFRQGGGGIFNFINMFSGGAMTKATVFALGIMPYISASIIIQLLTAVIPALEKLAREGESGRRKITEYTRYSTVALSLFQGFFISLWLEDPTNFNNHIIVPFPGWFFRIMTMVTLTTGTVFLMWLGEQITEKGIGNGISIIITVNILSGLPSAAAIGWHAMGPGGPQQKHPFFIIIMLAVFLFVIAGVIMLSQGQRKIPVQYAKRIIGRKIYGGQASYIPFRVNYAGVIPIIFASSILLFPATVGSMVGIEWIRSLSSQLSPGSWIYEILYIVLIVFFCFFWTATQFNPIQWADDMRKNGAFIPGIRPGKATADFFNDVMTKITLSGAVFLAFIAVLPEMFYSYAEIPMQVSRFFGG
ncbi:MAG: preprotein translocase subunit SecY, partial [Candidatus Aureabacteria bacterium]|nr:preprotein translocase subunit SecY [Candidatus Auribacterota bacterium]